MIFQVKTLEHPAGFCRLHYVSTVTPMTFSLAQIDQGIDALLKNASQLVVEANTLLGVSAFARAFALAHLAREELSKITMLYAAGARIAAGHEVDWQSLMKRLRDHKAKLRMETESPRVSWRLIS